MLGSVDALSLLYRDLLPGNISAGRKSASWTGWGKGGQPPFHKADCTLAVRAHGWHAMPRKAG